MRHFVFVDSTVLGASVYDFPDLRQAEDWVRKHYHGFSFEKIEDGLKFTIHSRVDLVQVFQGKRVTISPEETNESQ